MLVLIFNIISTNIFFFKWAVVLWIYSMIILDRESVVTDVAI